MVRCHCCTVSPEHTACLLSLSVELFADVRALTYKYVEGKLVLADTWHE